MPTAAAGSCRNAAGVERLPADTRLLVVQPAAADLDLSTLQAGLQSLRQELRKLDTTTGARGRYRRQGAGLCGLPSLRKPSPCCGGLGTGQQLDIRWPGGPDCNPRNGDGFSTIDGNALMLTALLQPTALQDAIMGAVQATLPMPKAELE